jgi:hypothetical protein
VKPLEEFHFFPKLPWELRVMIWEQCIWPQVVIVKNACYEVQKQRCSDTYYLTIVKAQAQGTTPAILHVNQESRGIGLKEWTEEFQPQFNHSIYFNWKRDTLFMENTDALIAFYGGPYDGDFSFGNDMSRIEKYLRHLVLGELIPNEYAPKKIIGRLYNLEALTLPEPPGTRHAVEKWKEWLLGRIHAWMEEKQGLYNDQEGVYRDWMLPEIEFMSKKEFAKYGKIVSHHIRSDAGILC